MYHTLKSIKPRTLALIERFRQEISGLAAVEFAIVSPLMILMFFGTIEISTAMAVNRKITRVSSTVGDLITQTQILSDSDITDIMKSAAYVMEPYDHTLKIIITGINITAGVATVDWSRSTDPGSAYVVGSVYQVPANILNDGTYLVAAKISTTHTALFDFASLKNSNHVQLKSTAMDMEEEIFLRPRIGKNITIQPSSPSSS